MWRTDMRIKLPSCSQITHVVAEILPIVNATSVHLHFFFHLQVHSHFYIYTIWSHKLTGLAPLHQERLLLPGALNNTTISTGSVWLPQKKWLTLQLHKITWTSCALHMKWRSFIPDSFTWAAVKSQNPWFDWLPNKRTLWQAGWFGQQITN